MLVSLVEFQGQGYKIGKYLLSLQDFFFRLKPKHYKNANIADRKKTIWKLIKQNKLFDGIFNVIFDVIFDGVERLC